MVKIQAAVLGVALAAGVFAQGRVGVGAGSGGRGRGIGAPPVRGIFPAPPHRPLPGAGFGSVVNPSGVPQRFGIVSPIYSQPLTFGQRLGATVTGSDFAVGAYHRQPWRGGIVPYPVFIGGYAPTYGGYGPTYEAPPPNVTVINTPPPGPTVIINQGYAPDRINPTVTEIGPGTPEPVTTYQAPSVRNEEGRPLSEAARPPANPEGRPTVYLIAMKSGEVYTALAYWLEDGTFHYITMKHAHNRASLDLIDAELSRQLNQERGLEFTLTR